MVAVGVHVYMSHLNSLSSNLCSSSLFLHSLKYCLLQDEGHESHEGHESNEGHDSDKGDECNEGDETDVRLL